MKRFVVGIIAAAVLVSMTRRLAQAKTVRSEMRTETATVEAIDAATRTITLKKPDGNYVKIVAGPDIKRFAEIKVGEKVNARYYENVVVRLKQPGEPEVETRSRPRLVPNRQCLVAPKPGNGRSRPQSRPST